MVSDLDLSGLLFRKPLDVPSQSLGHACKVSKDDWVKELANLCGTPTILNNINASELLRHMKLTVD